MTLISRTTAAGLFLGGGMLLASGCAAPVFVSATDPVLGICQQSVVLNLGTYDSQIDHANDNNPQYSSGEQSATALTAGQQKVMASGAAQLSSDVTLLGSLHASFASSLSAMANLLKDASQGPNGYVSNALAISTDNYAGAIGGACSSFQVGDVSTPAPAPKPHPAGPSGWVNPLDILGLVLAGYLLLSLWSAVALARREARTMERPERHTPGELTGRGFGWPYYGVQAVVAAWLALVGRTATTADERQDDRLRAREAEIARREAALGITGDDTGDKKRTS